MKKKTIFLSTFQKFFSCKRNLLPLRSFHSDCQKILAGLKDSLYKIKRNHSITRGNLIHKSNNISRKSGSLPQIYHMILENTSVEN